MAHPLKYAVVGIGRIGRARVLHVNGKAKRLALTLHGVNQS